MMTFAFKSGAASSAHKNRFLINPDRPWEGGAERQRLEEHTRGLTWRTILTRRFDFFLFKINYIPHTLAHNFINISQEFCKIKNSG